MWYGRLKLHKTRTILTVWLTACLSWNIPNSLVKIVLWVFIIEKKKYKHWNQGHILALSFSICASLITVSSSVNYRANNINLTVLFQKEKIKNTYQVSKIILIISKLNVGTIFCCIGKSRKKCVIYVCVYKLFNQQNAV